MAKLAQTALIAISISSGFVEQASAAQENACEVEILRAAEQFRIPVGILYAVGLAETGNRGSLHPNALNIEGKAIFARSPQQAIYEFEKAYHRGIKLIDLGCMQINHFYHSAKFPNLRAMLDPRMNVNYAAKFLLELKRRHKTWSMAIARYHAGPNNDTAQKRYVCRVIVNMVAVGFGKWTPQAHKFCI